MTDQKRYDPEGAAASLTALVAITDDELRSGVRAAAADLFARVDELRGNPDERAVRILQLTAPVVDAFGQLPNDAAVSALADAAGPILGAWIPSYPPIFRPVSDAVERLREAAIQHPATVSEARYISKGGS